MSANMWLILSVIFFALCAIMAVISVFVFIKLNIPLVIGDITGKTAAREIESIRQMNEESGINKNTANAVNINHGTLTDKVNKTEGIPKKEGFSPVGHEEQILNRFDEKLINDKSTDKTSKKKRSLDVTTDVISDYNSKNQKTDNLGNVNTTAPQKTDVLLEEKTDVLQDSQATEVLAQNTAVLTDNYGVTDILQSNNTTVLSAENMEDAKDTSFTVVRSIIMAESDEVII